MPNIIGLKLPNMIGYQYACVKKKRKRRRVDVCHECALIMVVGKFG